MRTIKELLVLLREKLPEYTERAECGSLCWCVFEMGMNFDIAPLEEDDLLMYIKRMKPEAAGNYWYKDIVHGFWWPYGELAPRLEFLDKLIAEIDEN